MENPENKYHVVATRVKILMVFFEQKQAKMAIVGSRRYSESV